MEKKGGKHERATLHRIASLSGVSVTTASMVLAGKGEHHRISEDTRARVAKIAEELHYAPNLLTRSLRRGRTHVLSFYSTFRHREEGDVYMDALSAAVELAGGEAGYDVLVHCNFNRTPREIYQFLNGRLADGLILFAPQPQDPLLEMLHESALPVVIVNGRDPEGVFPSISDDVESGMEMIADRLANNGHRRVAALTSDTEESRDAKVRIDLLRTDLRARGITIPDHWVRPCGHKAREELISLLGEAEPPSAIFCWHDRLAYSVLSSCETLGIEVPGRFSVVGYDGVHWPSATRHTAASVRVDQLALARRAVRVLDSWLNEETFPLEQTLPVTFLEGTSLGPAACHP